MIELPGRTTPYLIAELRPQVGGIVQQRAFTEGSEVRAGQLLYRIDAAPYQAAYDSAKANLARAEANLQVAKVTAERYAGLVSIQAVSKQANDDAQAALQLAQADIAAAKAALEKWCGNHLIFLKLFVNLLPKISVVVFAGNFSFSALKNLGHDWICD